MFVMRSIGQKNVGLCASAATQMSVWETKCKKHDAKLYTLSKLRSIFNNWSFFTKHNRRKHDFANIQRILGQNFSSEKLLYSLTNSYATDSLREQTNSEWMQYVYHVQVWSGNLHKQMADLILSKTAQFFTYAFDN